MNAMQALMPTHAALLSSAQSASSADSSPLRASAPPCESSDPIRKYVIVRDQAGREHPVIFSRDLVHKTMVPPDTTPVSAGFLLLSGSVIRVLKDFDSSSLHLSPRPNDEALLKSFLQQSC